MSIGGPWNSRANEVARAIDKIQPLWVGAIPAVVGVIEDALVDADRVKNAAAELLAALKRIIPMARDSKHEDFSDVNGNEDNRTAALRNAIAAIRKAEPASESAEGRGA